MLPGFPERKTGNKRKEKEKEGDRKQKDQSVHVSGCSDRQNYAKNNNRKDLRRVQEFLVVPVVHYYPADPEKRRYITLYIKY